MTDLEITRLCAEAMGWTPEHRRSVITGRMDKRTIWCGAEEYDPLYDDAQAMALVKKFRLHIQFDIGKWRVWYTGKNAHLALHDDLNYAICECVAKLKQGES